MDDRPHRVATNLENLEYSGISLKMEKLGILWEFCATSGKNYNKVFLVRHSNICVKQLLAGKTGSLGYQGVATLTFTFCCDNLWKSKFMALEKPGKLREFFLLLWPPCHISSIICRYLPGFHTGTNLHLHCLVNGNRGRCVCARVCV